jgi:hypothetical protein
LFVRRRAKRLDIPKKEILFVLFLYPETQPHLLNSYQLAGESPAPEDCNYAPPKPKPKPEKT